MPFSSIKSSLEFMQSALPIISGFCVLIAIMYTIGYYGPTDYIYISLHPITDYLTTAMKTLPFAVATSIVGGTWPFRHRPPNDDTSGKEWQKGDYKKWIHKKYWNYKSKIILAALAIAYLGYKAANPASFTLYGLSFNMIFTLAMFSYISAVDPTGVLRPEWRLLYQACTTITLAFFIGYNSGQSQIERAVTTTIDVREEASVKGRLVSATSSGFILLDIESSYIIYVERQNGMIIKTPFKMSSIHDDIESYLTEKCRTLGSFVGPCTMLVSNSSP